jgi:TetR/AcrR family transcriptional regulator, cholesterol catabolism regulator
MAQATPALRTRADDPTRQRILAVAGEWFATHGYAATSIRDIAGAVGVTVGAIYVHFPSKDRLLVAVYEEGVRHIGRAVDEALANVAGVDAWGRLVAAAAAHLQSLLGNASFARVLVRVIPADVPEAARDLRRLRNGYEERFRDLIAALDLAPRTDRRLLRLMLIGALNTTLTWFRRGAGRPDASAIAKHHVEMLRHGAGRTKGTA